jgi:hypothetical protein
VKEKVRFSLDNDADREDKIKHPGWESFSFIFEFFSPQLKQVDLFGDWNNIFF